eukprot:1189755-Rhodomonas_salina.1
MTHFSSDVGIPTGTRVPVYASVVAQTQEAAEWGPAQFSNSLAPCRHFHPAPLRKAIALHLKSSKQKTPRGPDFVNILDVQLKCGGIAYTVRDTSLRFLRSAAVLNIST